MAPGNGFKRALCRSLVVGGTDRLLRYVNRHNMLAVMYHGVTRRSYDPPLWTQLPVSVFRAQLEFLKAHYTIIPLARLLDAIRGGASLPPRAALLTFDDGLMNNYTVAFPLLEELGIPATIFLTSDYIGTPKIFWFDELYLLLSHLHRQDGQISDPGLSLGDDIPVVPNGEFPYYRVVNWMKRLPAQRRHDVLERLRQRVSFDAAPYREDFCPLGWDEVRAMDASGLVDFGAHTASHEILTNLDEAGLRREVLGSREAIEKHLGRPVLSFCYPNGRPGDDFTRVHEEYLAQHGFLCAFSTRNGLCGCGEETFAMRRIPVGNDGTSEPDYFRLNTAGALDIARRWGLAGK